jgi:uncharacterized delta-60 repeat protein
MLLAGACARPEGDPAEVAERAAPAHEEDFSIEVERSVRVPLGGLVELDVRTRSDFYDAAVKLDVASGTEGLVVVPGTIRRGYDVDAIRLGAQAPLAIGSAFTLRVVARAGTIERTADVRATVVDRAGALDPAFGDHGTAVAGGNKYSDDAFQDLMVLPDGTIVGVGSHHSLGGVFGRIVHRRADGSPDPRWPSALIGAHRSSIEPFAFGLESTGRMVVAGTWRDKLVLAGMWPDGTLDPSFGDGGRTIVELPGDSGAFALRVAANDRLIIAGYHNRRALVARFLPDGTPDYPTEQHIFPELEFRENVAAQAHDLALDREGAYLVAGEAGPRAFLARVRPNDIGGLWDDEALLPMPDGGETAVAQKIAIQPDGRIVIAGSLRIRGVSAVAVWRLLPGDSLRHPLDPSFGARGVAVIPVPGSFRPLAGFALLPDGRMVIAANAAMNAHPDDVEHEQSRPVLVRLRADGTVDPGSGPAGIVPVGLGQGNVISSLADAGGGALLLGFRWRQGAPKGGHFAGMARVWER